VLVQGQQNSKLDVKYLKNGNRYNARHNGGQIKTTNELLIGTMTFDLG